MGGVCRQSRWRHSVPSRPRWRVCVTMATLWQQQDGGYMLLWKRYGNNKMAAMRYYGNVIPTCRRRKLCHACWLRTRWSDHTFAVEDVYTELVIDVFYIFNSTVIDWTCFFYWIFSHFYLQHSPKGRQFSYFNTFLFFFVTVWPR